jgi:hypothetical protein
VSCAGVWRLTAVVEVIMTAGQSELCWSFDVNYRCGGDHGSWAE